MSKSVEDIVEIVAGVGEDVRPVWPDQAPGQGFNEVEHRVFGGESRRYYGGVWEGEPGELNLPSYPYDEICIMISGRIALRDTAGNRKEFVKGQGFFVPRGFSGVWETLEPSSKYFIALE
ncbi:cupin domain-containing protein [Burkholderia cepacia]|uniref:cupin domain-containing protein n=1 Tax=Burkholderia cepacia TaxID=292 RepID=UPI00075309AF|nr:cupin domain-containing protein [Burkholderia cepacia]KVS67661.1 hypothetical protein WK41_21795 [Burkholderia cepacia]